MKAKRPTLISLLTLLCVIPVNVCLAGGTTISGTASCIMPQLLEIRAQAPATTNTPQTPQAPVAMGASGDYDIQEEQKLITSEENIVLAENTTDEQKTTIYTVCAK